MAEAHSASLVSLEHRRGTLLLVDDDGLHLTFSVTIPPPRVMWLEAKMVGARLRNYFFDALFPLGPAALGLLMTTFLSVVLLADEASWWRTGPLATFVWDIAILFPYPAVLGHTGRLAVMTCWAVLIGFLLIVAAHRALLRLLLGWRGWMYDTPGKRSPYTAAWAGALKLLSASRPLTYSFQSSLPALPVPALDATVRRFMRSMRACTSPEEFAELETLAAGFSEQEGPRLQRYLKLKHLFSRNYVTDWWETYVYLKGRSPICINSNYYCLDSYRALATTDQAARAACLTRLCLEFRRQIADETLRPMRIAGGLVPLCMEQYRRTFSTTRVPGRDCDTLRHYEPAQSRHIAVICRGHLYCFAVERTDGALLESYEIEAQLRYILADAAAVEQSPASVPAMTAGDRTEWAAFRETYLSDGTNKTNLDLVERAILVVCLDDATPADLSEQGRLLLHGDATNRWFDKSVQLVIFSNGRAGFNGEHSWADAPVLGHMFEYACMTGEWETGRYDANGHCPRPSATAARGALPASVASTKNPSHASSAAGVSTPDQALSPRASNASGKPADGADVRLARSLPRPQRLVWSLSAAAHRAVDAAVESTRKMIDDLDLRVMPHVAFSKGAMKKCKVSPDAFIQVAMQLAYFRDAGRLTPTYESSMTRLYRDGRTETVRPCTPEVGAFVAAMEDAKRDRAEVAKLFREAAEAHTLQYKDAMSGRGVDRHLFALYVVSVGKDIESPFVKKALSWGWRLSTSQQPPQYDTTRWNLKNPEHAKRVSVGGGFGPVSDDGYGVSYMVATDDDLFFHVSSKRSAPNTDSARFCKRIEDALRDVRELLDQHGKTAAPAKK